MRTFFMAFCFVLLVGSAMPAAAEEAAGPDIGERWDDMAEEMKEKMQEMLDTMGAFFESIPQYEAPEVLENGDILIRRKNPDGSPREAQPPCICQT